MRKLLASFGWILLLFPVLSLAGVRTAIADDTENRNVKSFTSVSSSGAFDVFIKLGQQESLRLEGSKEDFEKIETVVENGDLKIRYKNFARRAWLRSGKVRVYITARTLKSLNTSGSGNIKVEGLIKAENFQTRLSGSGNINANLETGDLAAFLSGSGKIEITGSARNTDVSISGSGNFKGERLRTKNSNVKISGSGNVFIRADETLNAAISGSGNIYYSGNPKINSKVSGSGAVKRRE